MIRLADIDAGNWLEAVRLEVAPEQRHFVASNAFSLAEAYVKPEWPLYRPLAVYDDGRMVGFALYVADPSSAKNHYVQRLMIDHRFQGRGLGRAALVVLLKLIRENESCEEISLSVSPENGGAQNLYRSLGFEDTGEFDGDQKVFTLRVSRAGEDGG